MLKYLSVKVFVTDGSGINHMGAKIVIADRLGKIPVIRVFLPVFCF